jgi:hypothetical protein
LYPYWLLFIYFAVGALAVSVSSQARRVPAPIFFIIGVTATILLIGLRYRVGGDWYTYLSYFRSMGSYDFGEALFLGDPGYQAISWMAYHLGGGIWLVNLVCGAILAWGLTRFALTQKNPWLVFLVAVPYLINVVSMGYTRQSVAIGIVLAGLASLIRGKGGVLRFAVYVFFAALFHRTAVCVLPLVALVSTRFRLVNMVAIAVITSLLFNYLLSDELKGYTLYIRGHYVSQGANVRVAMMVLAAVLFLAIYRKFPFPEHEKRIWLNFSVASIAALVVLIISPSSTAVDRTALYLMPLQLAVLPQIPGVYAQRGLGTTAVVAYSAMIQFVWLNFGENAKSFVPYLWYNPFT